MLELIESILRWSGGLMAYATLGVVLLGIRRGTRRAVGQTSGRYAVWLRSPLFYLLVTLIFIGMGLLLWRPLPLSVAPEMRILMLAAGVLLYFPGLGFVLWGRFTLGDMYFVSTSQGAQLFSDHRLITSGPFAIVRHPMYLGVILAAFGGLLIFLTWTMVAFAFFAPCVLLRVRREERVLAAAFGKHWQEYCFRVPALFPRMWRKQGSGSE
jgi:isoprenylcysteine carboxyl methyltransferase (ICMT) family protein YpbQ